MPHRHAAEGAIMVSKIACDGFIKTLKDLANPAYSIKSDPYMTQGVCHVGIANRMLPTGSYGTMTLYDDASMHFDVPRKPMRESKIEDLLFEIEECGCDEAWYHHHDPSGDLQGIFKDQYVSEHIHANCPPDLSIRRCAIKKVLEEP